MGTGLTEYRPWILDSPNILIDTGSWINQYTKYLYGSWINQYSIYGSWIDQYSIFL